MSLQEPQTRPPTDGVDTFTRHQGRREAGDDLAPCLGCGTGAFDLWLNEGATAGRLVCVACGAVFSPGCVLRD